jgi:hypothetical protein
MMPAEFVGTLVRDFYNRTQNKFPKQPSKPSTTVLGEVVAIKHALDLQP